MFKLYSTNAPKTEVLEHILVTDNEAVEVGELLKLTNGKLTKASGANKPEFVSVGKRLAGVGVIAPVVRLMESDVYETVLSEAVGSEATLSIGEAVTISTDGKKATATKTNGVFTLTYIEGTTAGSKVRGMFRR